MTRYQTRQGDVLDEIIWRIHGVVDRGVVERTLEANPGLADLGEVYEAGVIIEIPDRETTPVRPTIALWE